MAGRGQLLKRTSGLSTHSAREKRTRGAEKGPKLEERVSFPSKVEASGDWKPWSLFATTVFVTLGSLLASMHAIASVNSEPHVEMERRNQSQLRLNEVMATQNGVLTDLADGDDNEDWFEIYNPTDKAVDLQGLYFTDRRGELTKHPITESLIISPFGYLIIWADGEPHQGPEHLSFRLSASGEAIGLIDSDGVSEIDFLIFGPQLRNQPLGRLPDGEGDWQRLPEATPGARNKFLALISHVQHEPPLPASFQRTMISAIITDNLEVVSATLFYSTTDADNVGPSALVEVPMILDNGDEYRAEIPGQAGNTLVSYYILAVDGEGDTSRYPRAAPSQVKRYLVGYEPPPLSFNEIMADNGRSVLDPDEPTNATPANKYPDWFEIYNNGDQTLDLQGLYLSDNPDNPTKNEITGTLIISPGGTLVIFADEDRKQGPRHVNFRLNDAGETLGLYGPFGAAVIDFIEFGPQTKDHVYGRYPDGQGEWTMDLCLTPDAPNVLCDQKNYLPFISDIGIVRASLGSEGE